MLAPWRTEAAVIGFALLALCAVAAALARSRARTEAEHRLLADNAIYAGAPIMDPATGHALGALCVVETAPRTDLDRAQREVLKGLARLVSEELGRRPTVPPAAEANAA